MNPHSIPDEFRREFTNNLELEIQQLHSRLSSRIKVEGFEGKEYVFNDLQSRSFKKRVTRLDKSDPTEAELNARKLIKVPFYDQVIYDRWDPEFLGKLGKPDSELIGSMRAAYGRLVDTEICKAAGATVYGGEEPYVTPIDLPSEQKVGVQFSGSSSNIGLTPEKVSEAIRIFETNDIYADEEELILVITPQEKADLISYLKTATNDVWAAMVSDWIKNPSQKLMGFNVISSNRVEMNGQIASCFAYTAQRGLYMSPEKLVIEMDVLPTHKHALQISAYATIGFMRRFEKGVVQIFCDQS